MPNYNLNWIYIGNLPDMDASDPQSPDVKFTLDNPSIPLGTYDNRDGSSTNDMKIVSVVARDANNDGQLFDGDGNYENVTWTDPDTGVGTTANIDSYSQYYATVTSLDGTVTNTIVHVMQLQNGDTFIGQVNVLDGLDITSIELTSLYADNFTVFLPNNSVDGSTIVEPVDGEATGENMALGYDDAAGATDGGGDQITNFGDVIYGNGGDDTIDGAGGDDTIDGGDGDDTFLILDGSGNDSIVGGETGEVDGDTVDLSGKTDGVVATYTGDEAGTITDGTNTTTFSEIENLTLTDLNDAVDGSASTADMSIDAGAGDDSVLGGSGDDVLSGGDGSDTLAGGLGADTLNGGADDDTIEGGAGDDVLTGGSGDDVFVYNAGDGADTITDFLSGTGAVDDGDPTNNDFVDLSGFYNATTLDAVNNADADPSNDFGNALGMLRADAADGVIDGVIDGVDYSAQIGDIDLTLQNGGAPVTGADLTVDNTNVPCFVRGTMIATISGQVAVEDLREGDKVITRDNGIQEIRWIGSRKVAAVDKMAPVKFEAGVLGNNETALWLSPNHRVLRAGWELELLFGTNEVLVPAKFFVGQDGISQVSGGNVEYFHILFDHHEIIQSNGAWTESFHPGQEGMGAFAEDVRQEILYLFPHLLEEGGIMNYGTSARTVLKAYEAELLKSNGFL